VARHRTIEAGQIEGGHLTRADRRRDASVDEGAELAMVSIAPVGGGDSIQVDNCRLYEAPRRGLRRQDGPRQVDAATFWVPLSTRCLIEMGQVYQLRLDDGTTRRLQVRRQVSPNAIPGRTMFFGVVEE
jgi:hypothetical protein